jgi:hypothetical protein
LPTNLVSGGNNLPIGTWTGGYNNSADVPGSAVTFTPSATQTVVPTGGASLWVYVGATVSPGGAQAAGSYAGNVVMAIAYL